MIHLYPNPETSETTGSYELLWAACQLAPRSPGAELVREGVTLATTDGSLWVLTWDGRQVLAEELDED